LNELPTLKEFEELGRMELVEEEPSASENLESPPETLSSPVPNADA
jgi:hypothetical protein